MKLTSMGWRNFGIGLKISLNWANKYLEISLMWMHGLWLVRAWVRIPFAAIFADILRSWFKLMTSRLLFSYIFGVLDFSLKNILFCIYRYFSVTWLLPLNIYSFIAYFHVREPVGFRAISGRLQNQPFFQWFYYNMYCNITKCLKTMFYCCNVIYKNDGLRCCN